MVTVNPPSELHQDEDKTRDAQRSLMKLYIGCSFLLVPAFALAVPYSVIINEWRYPFGTPLLPTLGLIPVGLGAVFALYRALVIRHKLNRHEYRILLPETSEDSGPKTKRIWQVLESLANLCFAFSILAVLIPTWIVAGDEHWIPTWNYGNPNRWISDGPAWLAAYASVSMLASMFTHIWLSWKVKPVFNWETPSRRPDRVCANCRNHIINESTPASASPVTPTSPKTSGPAEVIRTSDAVVKK